MKIPTSFTNFLKKLMVKSPSLFWSKKDKIPAFFILFVLLVLLFAYVIRIHNDVTISRSYDLNEIYSDEYIHIDVDLLTSTIHTRDFSGYKTVYGSPYQLVIHALPDVDAEHNEITQKDKDAFIAQESYKKISKAVIKNAKMVNSHDELIIDIGDIDLMGGSKVIIDGELHPLDRKYWADTATTPDSASEYFKGRIVLGKFDLNYEGYLVEGTLLMETTDRLIERHFIVGLPPKGEKKSNDGIIFTEVMLPTILMFLPMILMMSAFVAFVMKLITRIKYTIALKIQLILYLLFFYITETISIWRPDQVRLTILLLLVSIIIQIILYKIYSKRGYILIILGTILAPVIFYFSFIILTTLIFGGEMKFAL